MIRALGLAVLAASLASLAIAAWSCTHPITHTVSTYGLSVSKILVAGGELHMVWIVRGAISVPHYAQWPGYTYKVVVKGVAHPSWAPGSVRASSGELKVYVASPARVSAFDAAVGDYASGGDAERALAYLGKPSSSTRVRLPGLSSLEIPAPPGARLNVVVVFSAPLDSAEIHLSPKAARIVGKQVVKGSEYAAALDKARREGRLADFVLLLREVMSSAEIRVTVVSVYHADLYSVARGVCAAAAGFLLLVLDASLYPERYSGRWKFIRSLAEKLCTSPRSRPRPGERRQQLVPR